MSERSAKPVKTKEESMFNKAKDVIDDLWQITTDKAENFKSIAENKLENLKDKIIDDKPMPAKQASTAKAKIVHKKVKAKAPTLTQTVQTATKRVVAKKAAVSASATKRNKITGK